MCTCGVFCIWVELVFHRWVVCWLWSRVNTGWHLAAAWEVQHPVEWRFISVCAGKLGTDYLLRCLK